MVVLMMFLEFEIFSSFHATEYCPPSKRFWVLKEIFPIFEAFGIGFGS
jgi:hypothetical protein